MTTNGHATSGPYWSRYYRESQERLAILRKEQEQAPARRCATPGCQAPVVTSDGAAGRPSIYCAEHKSARMTETRKEAEKRRRARYRAKMRAEQDGAGRATP